MNKRLVIWAGALGLLVIVTGVWAASNEGRGPTESIAAGAISAPDGEATSPVARESQSLLAPTLKNVYFGMTQPQLQSARPRAVRKPKADEPNYLLFEEKLSGSERILYAIANGDLTLSKVQITGKLSRLEDVPDRIALMQSRYGIPTGIWDCPALPGQLPTRRFVFQRSALGVMDSFLMIGDQIAVTLYVAPIDILKQSLAIARCAPTPQAAMTRFPAVPLPNK